MDLLLDLFLLDVNSVQGIIILILRGRVSTIQLRVGLTPSPEIWRGRPSAELGQTYEIILQLILARQPPT